MANFHFKIITKVLADRLASIAPKIISTQQRGFIHDRRIQDCICLASEAINLLDYKTFGGNIAIKLDIKKAFDTLDWNFLMDTLKAFGFSIQFCNWIKVILHSARLSINVNGSNVGFFKCSRGVRQGDPLSSLLFCIVEDVLSRGITHLLRENKISTIDGPCNLKTPSHVLYADDILIFCKGVKKDLHCLKTLIQNYSQASGQHINLGKCKFYSSKASPRKLADITSYLGFSAGSLPFNYLGVPLFIGKPRRIHLQPIGDRILNKLSTWKGACLSIMGRVELVKSIIQRGLGIQSVKLMNRASLTKLAWDMRTADHEWADFYGKRFGCNSAPTSRYFKSSIWPGIRDNWEVYNLNSIWIVGSGDSINFWKDNWLGQPIVDQLNIPHELHRDLHATVADFTNGYNWNIPTTLANHCPEITEQIGRISRAGSKDRLMWKHADNGSLTLKEAHHAITNHPVHLNWCKLIWSRAIPPSKSFITWRIMHHKMPTDDNLMARGCAMASICNLCYKSGEDTKHIFISCPFATALWNWFNSMFFISINTSPIHNLLLSCSGNANSQVKEVMIACIIHIISTIWFCRNQARFEDGKIPIASAIARIVRDTTMSGNSSSTYATPTLNDLIILKSLPIDIHTNKAPRITDVIWYPPPFGWIKVNTDGAAHGSPGHSGGGGIFRNHNGLFLARFANYLGIQNALYAELHSAIKAVDLACKNGWVRLWLECDSMLLLDIFNGKSKPPWNLTNEWLKCNQKIQLLDFRISHIYREGNSCADKLASFGLESKRNTVWDSLPNFITDDCNRNRLVMPNYRFRNV
ncbi:PREDICTED: uncharacterized protein LOC109337509 [Lupinus angustifolius]|uniref:uncharacterized protein LOC109337509 n=1 Tax=Lupinus angustifolius TaxID=3871 RepID=UPI00092F95B3|nr:PREDICTED: uncharacterized protein LOC109337509 [Lupinus angustifolius]